MHFTVFRMPHDFLIEGWTLRTGGLCLSNNFIILALVIITFCLLLYYENRHFLYLSVSEFEQGLIHVLCEKTNVFLDSCM